MKKSYIGLKDIEGNKIYADRSIVELIMRIRKKDVLVKGYFSYDKKELRYTFFQYFKDRTRQNFLQAYLSPNDERIVSGFKIIDTIKENKLGFKFNN